MIKNLFIALIIVVFLFSLNIQYNNTVNLKNNNLKLENIINELKIDLKKMESELNKKEIELNNLNRLLTNKRKDVFIATAYCNDPTCIDVKKYQDGLTATGTKARIGVVAVDPKIISLGKRIYIEKLGWFVAEDVGGQIKGKRIDIFMENITKAREFGKKKVIVYY